MRKLLPFLLVIVLISGGYAFYWHKKAEQFKESVEQSIAALNTSAKPLTKDLALVRYEALNITGFPSTMQLEIRKPVVSLPVSELLHYYPHSKAGVAMPFEWIEELSYSDRVIITRNLVGSQYTYNATGDVMEKSLVNRALRHASTTSSDAPRVCHLGVEPGAGGPAGQALNLRSFLSAFRYFDCSTKASIVKDTQTGALQLTSDGISYSASLDGKDNANHKVALTLDTAKLKSTPAYDVILQDYFLMFYTLLGKPERAGNAMPFSEYGEHNIKADIHYDGPTQLGALAAPDASLRFDINTLELRSGISDALLTLHAAYGLQGDSRVLSFTFHEGANWSQHSLDLGKKNVVDILTRLQKSPGMGAGDPAMQLWGKLASLGAPEKTVDALYPDMHALGNIAFDVDFTVKTPNDRAKRFRQGEAVLNALNIVTTPYGITNKGSGRMEMQKGAAVGELSLTCANCDAFIHDLGGYAMRATPLLAPLNLVPHMPIVNQAQVEGARQFVHALAQDANARDLVVRFAMNGPNNITISGKQLPEVRAIYMSTLGPTLPNAGAVPGSTPEPATTPLH